MITTILLAGFGATRGPSNTLVGTGMAGRLPGVTLGGANLSTVEQMHDYTIILIEYIVIL